MTGIIWAQCCPKCGEKAGFEQVGLAYFCRHCSGLTTRAEMEALVRRAQAMATHDNPAELERRAREVSGG